MKSVFIVDDEKDIRKLYEKVLTLHGFEVKPSAKNGNEAIKMFKTFTKKPDIILMDHYMPGLNGLDAAKEILKSSNKTKIIIISNDENIKEKALKLGLSFISKNISNAEMVKTIKNL